MRVTTFAALVSSVFVSLACSPIAGPVSGENMKEPVAMPSPPSASRPSPPIVVPVDHKGIRYQEDVIDERNGDQAGGYLVAIDVVTGQRLWRSIVYEVPSYRADGVETMSRHFRTIKLVDDGAALEIENEVGGVYKVDLQTHAAVQIGGPPASAPKDQAPPPPPPAPE